MSETRSVRTYLLFTLAFIVFLVGTAVAIATRYEYIPAGKDMTYRVNRWTGSTFLCVADNCTAVKMEARTPVTPAVPRTTTWYLRQESKPNVPASLAGPFDSQAICNEALRLLQQRHQVASCETSVGVSTDPNGHWWVVLTKDLVQHIVTSKGPIILEGKAGTAVNGPYASDSICEVARLDRDDFSGMRCEDRSRHRWDPITLPQTGNAKLSLETKWQDGALLYHFVIQAPLPQRIKDARNGGPFASYTVILEDSDNFPVTQASISLYQMTPIVDDKGQTTYLEMYGTKPLSMKSYDAISGWTVSWNF